MIYIYWGRKDPSESWHRSSCRQHLPFHAGPQELRSRTSVSCTALWQPLSVNSQLPEQLLPAVLLHFTRRHTTTSNDKTYSCFTTASSTEITSIMTASAIKILPPPGCNLMSTVGCGNMQHACHTNNQGCQGNHNRHVTAPLWPFSAQAVYQHVKCLLGRVRQVDGSGGSGTISCMARSLRSVQKMQGSGAGKRTLSLQGEAMLGCLVQRAARAV